MGVTLRVKWRERVCGGKIEGEVEGEGVWSEMMMCVRRDE